LDVGVSPTLADVFPSAIIAEFVLFAPWSQIILVEITFPMRTLFSLTLLFAGLLLLVPHSSAQTTTTSEPVGFTTTSCLTNSDTLVALSFTRAPEFVGAIQSVSGNPANTITVTGTPWAASQFVYGGTQHNHYYVLIGSSNAKEGHVYSIIGNTASTLTVDTSIEDLSGIAANTQILVIPLWTLATVFPATDANVSFTPSASSGTPKTQILVPDYLAQGINPPYAGTFIFINNAWRDGSNADHSDDVLLPDGYFVVRNQNGAPSLPLTGLGSVLMKRIAVPLRTSASQAQDNAVGMVRPFDVTLNASGLNPADGSFVANDQLLVFDNTQTAINKPPSAIYYYDVQPNNGGGWRLLGDAVTDRGNDVIPAGSGMVVRKASKPGAPTVFWTNAPPVYPFKAVSRKNHGSGTFDITLPLAGNLGVECRSGGPTQIVLTFPGTVTFSSTAVSSGSVSNTSGSGTTSVTVNLSGLSNAQKATLNLTGVTNGTFTANVAVPIGILFGDVTGNGSVNATDVSQAKSSSGQAATASNFRSDVIINGLINSTDISSVKSSSGTAIP
jgi:uncharacterized protein (TIGR02597 family)